MGIGSTHQILQGSHLDAAHPICRGDIPTLVFSGDAELLGELSGEPTAYAIAKFVLPDPTIEGDRDLASAMGMLLPRWEGPTDRPIDGVCFAFTSPAHPALRAMIAQGAVRDEHVILIDTDGAEDRAAAALHDRLRRFLGECSAGAPSEAHVIVVGYGHQGRELAARLRDEFGLPPRHILIHERSPDARARAMRDGFSTLDESDVITTAVAFGAGVLCSPLLRHDRLHRLLELARERGLPTFDNAQIRTGAHHYFGDGAVRLTAAARRTLVTDGHRVELRDPALPQRLTILREDIRVIRGREFVHLHASRVTELDGERRATTVVAPRSDDPLPPATLRSIRKVFVGLGTRADHAFFAAREVALGLWPAATREVLPAEHACDLGGTTLERLLLGHLVGREVASTMQTPAQRATLGVVARHYAADRPIVEIGSAFGGSALLMAAATDRQRPTLWSVDPDAPTRDIMRFAFGREGQGDRLRQIVATSDIAMNELAELRGSCGLVMIDGLHTMDGVAADAGLYAPLVAPGGALVFHDAAPQIETVMRVVLGRMLDDPRFTLRLLVDGLAIFERHGGEGSRAG
jgi:predicted O-methyltransferase YrrM